MAGDLVQLTTAGAVATLTLNRPEKRNALTTAMLDDMLIALERLESDRAIGALIVCGAGDAFCAGVDLREMLADREAHGGVDHRRLQELFVRLDEYPNPTIAVVQGVAMAGGCELALHCDLRIVSAEARFGMPLARIGIVVPFVLAQRLTDLMGLPTARDLLLTGDTIGGERAFQLRLATRLTAAEGLGATARQVAERIAANAPLAVREMKRLLRRTAASAAIGGDAQFDEARRRISQSDDVREGLEAFLERRPAAFRGH
jgi:enoyl-CoA hydratase/carnithine racemase